MKEGISHHSNSPNWTNFPEIFSNNDYTASALQDMRLGLEQLDEVLQRDSTVEQIVEEESKCNEPHYQYISLEKSQMFAEKMMNLENMLAALFCNNRAKNDAEQTVHVEESILQTVETIFSIESENLNGMNDDTNATTAKQFKNLSQNTKFKFHVQSSAHDSKDIIRNEKQCLANTFLSMSLKHFQLKLQQTLTLVDHLLPTEVKNIVSKIVIDSLLSEKRCMPYFAQKLLKTLIPCSADIKWTPTNLRLMSIGIRECYYRRKWGLMLEIKIKEQNQVTEAQGGGILSAEFITSCKYLLFVPKSQYKLISILQLQSEVIRSKSYSISLTQRKSTGLQRSTSCSDDFQQKGASLKSQSGFLQDDDDNLPELFTLYIASLDEQADKQPVQEPQPLNAPLCFSQLIVRHMPFTINRIMSVASSRHHTLLVNDLGMVYTFGLALDGCLGLGKEFYDDEVSKSQPRLVQYFFDNLIAIRVVSCGGDKLTGLHSAAATRDGRVYTWGVGTVLGLGHIKSMSEPQLVKFPEIEISRNKSVKSKEKKHGEISLMVKINKLSSGCGMCFAVDSYGHAYSWGKWDSGRLGLGPIPILCTESSSSRLVRGRRRHVDRKQLQQFQLKPKLITLSADTDDYSPLKWQKICCGDRHVIALTTIGTIFTWGSGSHGQLGHGNLNDILSPAKVEFRNDWTIEKKTMQWVDIAAGENWSISLDNYHRLWSWGACGSRCLGHHDDISKLNCATNQTILTKHLSWIKEFNKHQQSKNANAFVPALPSFPWSRPKIIQYFAKNNVDITRIGAGLRHAAAISSDGDLYCWGDVEGLPQKPKLVTCLDSDLHTLVGRKIADKRINNNPVATARIFCGGNQLIVAASGSFLRKSMLKLFSICSRNSNSNSLKEQIFQHELNDSHNSINKHAFDVILIVGAAQYFAHKFILARRSNMLRNLIRNEELERIRGNGEEDPMTLYLQIMLPHLRQDVAHIMLEFLYTDNISVALEPHGHLIRDLLRAAQLYEVGGLEALCKHQLQIAGLNLEDKALSTVNRISDEAKVSDDSLSLKESLSCFSLQHSLSYDIGDTSWCDVVIKTKDRNLYAHKCMLVIRSVYFDSILHNSNPLPQSNIFNIKNATEIKVDEPYDVMIRVLQYIYEDKIGELKFEKGDNDKEKEAEITNERLEDLRAAFKYGLRRLRLLCEHDFQLTNSNYLNVLSTALDVGSCVLKQRVVEFIICNLSTIVSEPLYKTLQVKFPFIITDIYNKIQQNYEEERSYRDWHNNVETSIQENREMKMLKWKNEAESIKFPWKWVLLAIICAVLYILTSRTQVYDLPYTPAINVIVLSSILVGAYMGFITV